MIVKNESKIIERTLKSLVKIIDSYAITDTGSTDDTVAVIKKIFDSHNIPGEIHHEPFKNFEHNRNCAINNAASKKSDLLLLLDADMVLQYDESFLEKIQVNKCHHFYQGNSNFYYQNIRLIPTAWVKDKTCQYVGKTHEFLNVDGNVPVSLPRDVVFINDIGDGANKVHKYERDIKLLLSDINENEPLKSNRRSVFYLANSYFDTQKYESAIKYYNLRVLLGGWSEEIYMSFMKTGIAQQKLNKDEEAVLSFLKCSSINKTRVEHLFHAFISFTKLNQFENSNMMYKYAQYSLEKYENTLNGPDNATLFFQASIHEYLFDYYYLVYARHFDKYEYYDVWKKTINSNNTPSSIRTSLMNNLTTIDHTLGKPLSLHDISHKITLRFNKSNIDFFASTPSILELPSPHVSGEYIAIVRYVNYRIKDDGSYNIPNGQIISIYKRIVFDKNFKVVGRLDDFFHFPSLDQKDCRYIGLEDVRIFKHDNKIKFSGTHIQGNQGNDIGIALGNYNLLKNSFDDVQRLKTSKFVHTQVVEKNWAFFENHEKKLRFVYKFYPLTICNIKGDQTNVIEEIKMPLIFSSARGSSNGVKFKDEIWFVVHHICIDSKNKRHYYDQICVFDEHMALKNYTRLYKQNNTIQLEKRIQFNTSIIVNENFVILPYSIFDSSAFISIYPKSDIEALFF